jgi:ribosomal protein S7
MDKIDFTDYKKQIDSLKDYYAIKQVVKKLLKNVIETGKERKIKNIVYNYDFYEGEKK